jgi:hypothetical protein
VSASGTFDFTLHNLLIAEVFDAIARLDAYLHDVESSAQPRSGIPLNLFRDVVHKVLYPSLEEPLRLIKHTTASGKTLDPSEIQAIVNLAGSTFIGLAGVHRFLKYLRSPEPPSELFALLREIQQTFPDPAIRENNPDVLLSEIFNYGEIDLHAALEWKLREVKIFTAVPGKETIVIVLPYTQVNNPLMWTIISHEVGHFAEKRYSLGRTVLAKILKCDISAVPESTELDWVEEFISDLVAIRSLGPAYLLSFISLTISQSSLGSPSLTHPSDLGRVKILFDDLTRNCLSSVVPSFQALVSKSVDLYNEKFRFNQRYLADKDMGPSAIHGTPIQDVIAMINQELDDRKMTRLGVDSLRSAENLAAQLAQGQPISAFQPRRAKLKEDLAQLDKHIADKDQVRAKDLFCQMRKELVETPCTCTEIINAGYLHKYTTVLPAILERLTESSLEDYAREYRTTLIEFDRQLKVSLQTVEIHKLFL